MIHKTPQNELVKINVNYINHILFLAFVLAAYIGYPMSYIQSLCFLLGG